MYSLEFDHKIDDAVADGYIVDTQREALHEEGRELGIDDDELDIVIDGKIYLVNHKEEPADNKCSELFDGNDDSFVESTDDEGLSLSKYWTLLRNNRAARIVFILVACVLLSPILLPLLAVIILAILPSSCIGSDNTDTVISDSTKTEIVVDKAESFDDIDAAEVEEEDSPANYEGRDDIAWCGDIACKISHSGKKLIIEYLDENGKPQDKKNKLFEETIIKTMCYDDVYVVVNMLEEGEESKLPFVGLYKVDLLHETCELLDTANYIDFDRNAGKAKLKTATGLAGDGACAADADSFIWEEKTINL